MDVKRKDERDLSLDVIKGLAILLVVFGHAIQYNLYDFDENLIFRLIYSFHMPLFMFVSGYIASKTKVFDLHLIKKKYFALVIPFLVWYLISYIVKCEFNNNNIFEYILNFLKSPDKGLWFLWILFLNFCVLTLVIKLQAYNKILPIILIIPLLFIIGYKVNILGLTLLAWYFVFFLAGFLISKNKKLFEAYFKRAFIFSIIFFPVLVLFWQRTEGPLFLSNINISQNSIIQEIIRLGYNYIVAFLAIVIVFYVVKSIAILKQTKTLIYLGGITLDIYILHFYFLYFYFLFGFGIGTDIVRIFTTFVFALFCSIIFSYFIRKSRKATSLLFGIKL